MTKKTIALWGDTQVGKTTLLAAALCSQYHGFDLLDLNASNAELGQTLAPIWRLLQKGMPTPPTSSAKIDIRLTCKGGTEVHFRDVRGAIASGEDHNEKLKIIDGSDAIIFVLEWNGRNMADQFNAVSTIVTMFDKRPKALVFTKCEKTFEAVSEVWDAFPEWWRENPALAPHSQVISLFGTAVWPTSSWGYDNETWMPCAILGEFGQLIPFRINPKGVEVPFYFIFRELGLIP
ncbi:hypothetical protein KP003_14225 [Geomonas nitrogeniifigens]|uniref:GTPase domain-containing protein n=1 Tax=Geomonas diazotrophica TaxID=2843197 RepID=UPI001C2C904E|nr:GTPase domain-containing protein [Geomonas nitrogeniifigens]QXE85533.1 hypothetical protein KP003_14225 [Geomonas nitrogeniifigens]